jgi:hypothetical protein
MIVGFLVILWENRQIIMEETKKNFRRFGNIQRIILCTSKPLEECQNLGFVKGTYT